jgi:hypothetical protein
MREYLKPNTLDKRRGKEKRRRLLLSAVILVAFCLLIVSLNLSPSMEPGRPQPPIRLIPVLPPPLYGVLFLLLLGSVIVLFILLLQGTRWWKKQNEEFQLYQEPRKPSPALLILALFCLLLPLGIFYYLSHYQYASPHFSTLPFSKTLKGSPEERPSFSPAPLPPEEAPIETASPLLSLILFGLAALLVGSLAFLGLWVWLGEVFWRWRYGRIDRTTLQELIEAMTLGIEDLVSEPDPRRAVIACYRRLEQMLRQQGLPRRVYQTPGEYMRIVLCHFSLPTAPCTQLTRLFERARFSQHTLDTIDKAQAIAALTTIRESLDTSQEQP